MQSSTTDSLPLGASLPRYAVVTGANKGIGFEIVRQLASAGIKVVLTARDEKRGLQALETFKASPLSDFVVFHQLDVADASSVASLAHFVKSQFGKLDILVNNAGISGIEINDNDLFTSAIITSGQALSDDELRKATLQTYELAKECIQINYEGAKTTFEYLLPLLELSDSPRVVNVSSFLGKIQNVSNEWAKGVFSDVDNLTEERIDEVLKEFIKDYEEGPLERKGWPRFAAAYVVAKASMNAYTRIIAKKYPSLCISCVCPGYVKTYITANTGFFTVEEGASNPVRLALLPNGSPSGLFYFRNEVSSF
ncbi:(+)-neomenthol dehydrogenase-like isoform X2 [Trifolium pratense]|uniref:(+)-neomenthol dehydrogenase-like isoform X2 n=1 Tax=Trifolium pratense TaxID=57577 RepID=UPI001E6982D5|nr:(+)-neomenthol dehydrogenase-like isoform X2 [Trifolium pratense]